MALTRYKQTERTWQLLVIFKTDSNQDIKHKQQIIPQRQQGAEASQATYN